MTRVLRTHWPAAMGIAVALIGIAAVLPLLAERAVTRRIVLVAKDMSFVIDGQRDANPALELTAGERVQIVLRNQTPGIEHDFAIPAWKVAIAPIANGDEATITFDVPATVGLYEYECRPHAQMMRGRLEVVAP